MPNQTFFANSYRIMSSRKILFIVNPSAGKKRNLDLQEFIEKNFNLPGFTVAVSSSLEYFEEIKQKILTENYTDVIACGGDGTGNKVASFACKHSLHMGILPLGSGKCLARSVGISMDLKKALKQIETGKLRKIDAGVLNDKLFFCASGMGFDAHIAALFEKSSGRGLWGYIKLITKEFFSYKGEEYRLTSNYKHFCLHGGVKGFDKVWWDIEEQDDDCSLRKEYLNHQDCHVLFFVGVFPPKTDTHER